MGQGDAIEIEDMRLDVLETPGHTPEHGCYVVTDRGRGPGPVGVFTGDTLFVGDVGRPDLFPGRGEELAGRLYHSLHDVLLHLPDHCEVYPAHGAGSLCGRSVGAKYRTTIGYERRYNAPLQIRDEAEFIRSLTSDMPPAPDHFSRLRSSPPRSSGRDGKKGEPWWWTSGAAPRSPGCTSLGLSTSILRGTSPPSPGA